MIKRILFWIFYWLDPAFRRFWQSKRVRRGPNEPVATGEQVIAVLQSKNGRRTIR